MLLLYTAFHLLHYGYYPVHLIVGSDYTTLTGQDDIRVEFSKGSYSTFVEILIHHDLEDEDEEYFTAELQTELRNRSAKVIIRDAFTVLCSFAESAYDVYESVGSVNLTLNSNRTTPSSNYTVQVETIYGSGSASGELVYIRDMMDGHSPACVIWNCDTVIH